MVLVVEFSAVPCHFLSLTYRHSLYQMFTEALVKSRTTVMQHIYIYIYTSACIVPQKYFIRCAMML